MNKKLVDELLPDAAQVLKDVGVAANGRIDKAFRGQISSFGAAVSMGSLLAAAAFFNDPGSAKSDRSKLMKAINKLLADHHLAGKIGENLFETIRNTPKEKQHKLKADVLACAVALKLAMNLFDLKSGNERKEGSPLESAL